MIAGIGIWGCAESRLTVEEASRSHQIPIIKDILQLLPSGYYTWDQITTSEILTTILSDTF